MVVLLRETSTRLPAAMTAIANAADVMSTDVVHRVAYVISARTP
jgi:hypothetical protein